MFQFCSLVQFLLASFLSIGHVLLCSLGHHNVVSGREVESAGTSLKASSEYTSFFCVLSIFGIEKISDSSLLDPKVNPKLINCSILKTNPEPNQKQLLVTWILKHPLNYETTSRQHKKPTFCMHLVGDP